MGGSLVGHHVGPHAARDELWQNRAGIAQQRDRYRFAMDARILDHRQGFVYLRGLLVYIPVTQTTVDTCFITFDNEHAEPRHDSCQRLRTAHTAQAGGQDPFTLGIALVVLPRQFCEGFVSSLNDALAADVDP